MIKKQKTKKNPTCPCNRCKRCGFDLWSGRPPGGGHGNPLQYSCLENPMNREAWRAIVHRVAKSHTQLKQLSMHANSKLVIAVLLSLSQLSYPLRKEYSPAQNKAISRRSAACFSFFKLKQLTTLVHVKCSPCSPHLVAWVFVLHLTELKGPLFHFLVTTEFKYLWFGLWAHNWKVVIIAISR